MAHPNDTLQGKLFAFEIESEKHLRRSFGYWRMVEKRMIRAQLEAEGFDLDDWKTDFEISRRVTENHKNDPTLREQQKAARAAAPPYVDLTFTDAEMEDIIDRYNGANTKIGQTIFNKAWATMVRRGLRENAA